MLRRDPSKQTNLLQVLRGDRESDSVTDSLVKPGVGSGSKEGILTSVRALVIVVT